MLSAFRRPHPHGRSMYIQQFALVLTAHIGLGLPVCQYGLPSAPPPPRPSTQGVRCTKRRPDTNTRQSRK